MIRTIATFIAVTSMATLCAASKIDATQGPRIDVSAYNGDLAAAVNDASERTVVVSRPTKTVAGSFVVPANVQIEVLRGGSIVTGPSVTLTINGNLNAGPYPVFSGSGTIAGLKSVYPQWFHDGSGDWTSAFNKAIATVRSNAYGGIVHVLAGVYRVTSINASMPVDEWNKGLTVRGEGTLATSIIGIGPGSVVFDALGANNITLEDFTIGTSVIAQTGLLFARSSSAPNCSKHKIKNVNIDSSVGGGGWSVAAHVAIASESNTYISPRFCNTYGPAAYTAFYTSNYNDCGVTSQNGEIIASSNTDNRMYSAEFYEPYDNAHVLVFNGSAGYSFYSPLVVTGGAKGGRLATYRPHAGDTVFNGPVNWFSPLFEGKNPVAHYLQVTPNTLNYFYQINSYGGYYNLYDAGKQDIIGYDQGGATFALLGSSVLEGAKFNPQYEPHITLYAVDSGCRLNLLGIGHNGVITITGYQGNSLLQAETINEAATSVNYHGQSYGTGTPVTGSYARGHFRWNTDQATLQGQGLVGWECVASGTPGTWAPLYRGGLSGPTGNRPRGRLPAGFLYYDTTIGKPLWWTGNGWRLADGTSAPEP